MSDIYDTDNVFTTIKNLYEKYTEMKWYIISLETTIDNLKKGYPSDGIDPKSQEGVYDVKQACKDYNRLCKHDCELCPFNNSDDCSFSYLDYDKLRAWAKAHPEEEK